jgi:BirA family biotin operon repressor/biotin-[acetyl-CoA-carboxylase] ligase
MLRLGMVRAWLEGPWRLEWHPSVTSTNDLALAAARAGEPEGLVIGAEEQTAGRGRQGRRWIGLAGKSLLFSILLRPPGEVPAQGLGLAATAALLRAARQLGAGGLQWRWPNDVVAEGRKVAGILVETARGAAVVGVGINVLGSPGDFPSGLAATTLAALLPHPPRREQVLALVLNEFRNLYAQLRAGGFRNLLASLAAADALRGRQVTVALGGGQMRGQAGGCDEAGRLILHTPEGCFHLTAGEVKRVE